MSAPVRLRRLPGNIYDIFDSRFAYGLECTTQMGGTRKYCYTFRIADRVKYQHARGASFECTLHIQRLSIDNEVSSGGPDRLSDGAGGPEKRETVNTFTLYAHEPGFTYVLVCDRVGSSVIQPPICMVLQYRSASRQWMIESGYNNIRALFTLNVQQESFGILAALGCTSCRVVWDVRGVSTSQGPTMTIEARGGWWNINRFTPCDLEEWSTSPSSSSSEAAGEQITNEQKQQPPDHAAASSPTNGHGVSSMSHPNSSPPPPLFPEEASAINALFHTH
jgi:hypothetical protein